MKLPQLASVRDRRQFTRLSAAVLSAATAAVLGSKGAKAAGRHSDPDYEENCMLRGTRIQTARGLVAVEDLAIDDKIVVHDGTPRAIKWVGCSTIPINTSGTAATVRPIRIARSAIKENVPERDVYLSPAHAIYIDGNLIPARYLVNGTSITECYVDGGAIEYWHVLLDDHAVMSAEGMAVETLAPGAKLARADHLEAGAENSFAPVLGYNGGRQETRALIRSLASKFVDVRDPIQRAFDQIAERGSRFS